ncbi:MAG: response regulator transcription factor [Chitinophagaceae bacterium]|nr:response regulator transcription factor [Chitinophagaceae bacterium]
MQRYKCIIVEDEPLATGILKSYIQRVPHLELDGEFRDAISAGSHLQELATDILFLDIHLPELKGLDFLRTLTKSPAVVLTTAYHQYAVEGFELSVSDYLLKPYSFDRFLLAVNKAIKQIQANQVPVISPVPGDNFLYLTIERRKVKIIFDDIDYIESSREYVKIFTEKAMHISKVRTSELEKMLPVEKFRRIHRSFIVATGKIDSYNKEFVEVRGKKIPIGGGFKKDIAFFKKG